MLAWDETFSWLRADRPFRREHIVQAGQVLAEFDVYRTTLCHCFIGSIGAALMAFLEYHFELFWRQLVAFR